MPSGMDALLAAMFAAGLASGLHCVAMCGGIVAAFDAGVAGPDAGVAGPDAGVANPHSNRVIPIRTRTDWYRRLAFNLGRISAYAVAGAVAGLLGGAAVAAAALPAQTVLYVAANIMLVLMGLHLAGAGRVLGRLEEFGAPLWRRLQPLAARLLPARTPAQACAAGFVWGWLPCGMVYAALAGAMLAGSAARGALAMAAFGAGTLPFLLAAGWLASRLRAWRVAVGGAVLGFGTYGLAHAGGLGEAIRRGLLCL
jgi:sulfite exporter TauE/SafE